MMTSNRILMLNAIATAGCGIGMLATRNILYTWFGAASPALFDAIAAGLLAYAGALGVSARQPRIGRGTLMAFTAADALWVAGSFVVLVAFWGQLTPIARVLVIAVAAVVEVFATLQYRAASRVPGEA